MQEHGIPCPMMAHRLFGKLPYGEIRLSITGGMGYRQHQTMGESKMGNGQSQLMLSRS